ncbi:MAG: asparagine synthetase B family protein, partial [Gammaproteobacteria bacterium]
GHVLVFNEEAHAKKEAYWDLKKIASNSEKIKTDPETIKSFEALIEDAVTRRMVADVPLGAFLSGGIDSSLVVALMQKNSLQKINTFSIGFGEKNYNEAQYAKAVAEHVGTNHHELYVSDQAALDVIPHLAQYYDEPFADSSQIPTYLVSKLAREKVIVSLSGDGGDELFGGYTRYIFASHYWKILSKIPAPLRSSLAFCLRLLKPQTYDQLPLKMPNIGNNVYKLADSLEARDPLSIYLSLVHLWPKPLDILNIQSENHNTLQNNLLANTSEFPVFFERMQLADQLTYLPDDILTKVDRASMAVALEARVPLLDHRVVERSWSLPLDAKIQGKVGKQLLRNMLYQYVPRTLIERPKMGFGIPLNAWLKGPLRAWAEDLLSPEQLSKSGLFKVEAVQNIWKSHLAGHNQQYRLWCVLMFQAWYSYWF